MARTGHLTTWARRGQALQRFGLALL